MRLVARLQPVALDFRFLLMVTRIDTELERIDDQAWNTCEYIQLLVSEPELKRLVDWPRMSDLAARRVEMSLEAFDKGPSEEAMAVIRSDDAVDGLNDQIFRELVTYRVTDAKNIGLSVALHRRGVAARSTPRRVAVGAHRTAIAAPFRTKTVQPANRT